MISIIVGLLLLLFSLWASLPISWGLQWTEELLIVLRGGLPLGAAFFGLLFVVVGLMVVKDRVLAKREEKRENDNK